MFLTKTGADMAEKPKRILREAVVIDRTGRSRTTIFRDVRSGTFPAPIAIGPRAKGWLESDIEAWIARQIDASRDAARAAAARMDRNPRKGAVGPQAVFA
jgi:prophage regulatory protein